VRDLRDREDEHEVEEQLDEADSAGCLGSLAAAPGLCNRRHGWKLTCAARGGQSEGGAIGFAA
jgi:hypothetical protein